MNVEDEANAQKTFSCHLLYLFFILMGVKNVLLMLVLPQLKSCVVVVQSKRNFLGINDVSSYTDDTITSLLYYLTFLIM